MGELLIHQNKIKNIDEIIRLCPFNALESRNGKLEVSSACKMCKLCVKKSAGAIEYIESKIVAIDKSSYRGIAVYVDFEDGQIHPVTYELIGKAKELADKINHPLYAVFMGANIKEKANELLYYGVDEVFICDHKNLADFRIEPYTAVMEAFINKVKPSTILVGATTVGRSLAPRVAARFKTGLTADCTILDMKPNTDLIQIRPAFGGNIMAQINTPNHRPQIATVRYKVMNAPEKSSSVNGKITELLIADEKLTSQITVLEVLKKELEKGISEAEVIIAAGRGIKSEKDLVMIRELAKLLGGEVATTRPLIESGWMDAKRQIGLSGRTVRPKLIITCGISGSVQFVAGMSNAECIIAINSDENAPVFKVAHYAVIGDLYEVVPQLISDIKKIKEVSPHAI